MPKDFYAGYHYFLGIYHILTFGKSEMFICTCIFHLNSLFCALGGIVIQVPLRTASKGWIDFLYLLNSYHMVQL